MIFCRCSVGLLFLLLSFALCYERKDSLHTTVSEGRKLTVHQELQNNTEFPINIKILTVTRRKHNRHRFPRPNPQRRRPSYQLPPSAPPPVPSPFYSRPPPTYSYLSPAWYPPYPPVPYPPASYPPPPYVPTIRWSQSPSQPPSPSILSDPLHFPLPDVTAMRQPPILESPSPSMSPSLSSLPSPSPMPTTSSDPLTLLSSAISATPSATSLLSPSPSPTPPTDSLSSPPSALPPSPETSGETSLSLLTPPSPADLKVSIPSPLVTKADYCEVVVFLCNLENNSAIPEPPARFCEHFTPSCAATNLLSAPTQTLTWLCQMFPSHWMCNAPVKTPNTFCNQFASHWTCLTHEEISDLSILSERRPERPKQVKWFCQHFPTDWMCEDPVMPPTGFCEKFHTHWACINQESSMDGNSQPPAELESFCNLVPTYWMCESPIQPPAGFCEEHPQHWACEIQIANVEAQAPLCVYFPCEDTKASSIDKHHMDHSLPVSELLKYSDVQIPQSGSIRIPSELLKTKRREPTIHQFAKAKPVRVVRPNKSVYQPVGVDYQQRIADLD